MEIETKERLFHYCPNCESTNLTATKMDEIDYRKDKYMQTCNDCTWKTNLIIVSQKKSVKSTKKEEEFNFPATKVEDDD